jgi:drug/metabolite transporter (DMT)-like permease
MKSILLIILVTSVGVLGDFFIKLAGVDKATHWRWLALGTVLYAATAIGWFRVMKHVSLSALGAIYALTTVLLLVAIGVAYFHERLNTYEVVGIVMAILSVVLLSRFA